MSRKRTCCAFVILNETDAGGVASVLMRPVTSNSFVQSKLSGIPSPLDYFGL